MLGFELNYVRKGAAGDLCVSVTHIIDGQNDILTHMDKKRVYFFVLLT